MKKFKTKSIKSSHKEILLIIITITTFFIINYYNKKISPKLINVATTKIEEITNLYIKNNIVPQNVDVNKLININKNSKDEILYVDIDTNYANEIMVEVIKKIQANIFEFNTTDSLLKRYRNNNYLMLPLLISNDGVLFQNIGPQIPIKLNFYEHAFGNIKVELVDYGINNALIKVFLEVYLEQKMYLPYKEEKLNKKFDLLISSKIINGSVPSIYGGSINKTSSTLSGL